MKSCHDKNGVAIYFVFAEQIRLVPRMYPLEIVGCITVRLCLSVPSVAGSANPARCA